MSAILQIPKKLDQDIELGEVQELSLEISADMKKLI